MSTRSMVGDTLLSLAVGPILFAVGTSVSAAAIVFSDDFDGGQSTAPGVTAAWSGVTSTENVLGYSAVTGFSGNFLRNTTGGVPTGTPGTATTLTLTGLPPHTSIDLEFLLATIDTWDGTTGNPGPDYFNVRVDGAEVFEASFAQQSGIGSGYNAPPGGALSLFVNLFNPTTRDGAYDMSVEPALSGIPHSASSLVIDFWADGAGWQGDAPFLFGPLLHDSDESWAIENVRVSVTAVPEASSFLCLGALGLVAVVFRTLRLGGISKSNRWLLARRG